MPMLVYFQGCSDILKLIPSLASLPEAADVVHLFGSKLLDLPFES